VTEERRKESQKKELEMSRPGAFFFNSWLPSPS
jgi:hypothetical protein